MNYDQLITGTAAIQDDTDHDGLPDDIDPFPNDPDKDQDKIVDGLNINRGHKNEEFVNKSWDRIKNKDTDNDGIYDIVEEQLGTNPEEKDSDKDNFPDALEIAFDRGGKLATDPQQNPDSLPQIFPETKNTEIFKGFTPLELVETWPSELLKYMSTFNIDDFKYVPDYGYNRFPKSFIIDGFLDTTPPIVLGSVELSDNQTKRIKLNLIAEGESTSGETVKITESRLHDTLAHELTHGSRPEEIGLLETKQQAGNSLKEFALTFERTLPWQPDIKFDAAGTYLIIKTNRAENGKPVKVYYWAGFMEELRAITDAYHVTHKGNLPDSVDDFETTDFYKDYYKIFYEKCRDNIKTDLSLPDAIGLFREGFKQLAQNKTDPASGIIGAAVAKYGNDKIDIEGFQEGLLDFLFQTAIQLPNDGEK